MELIGELTENSRVRRREDVASRVLAGETETVLLDIKTGAYFGLNAVGSFMWDQLGQGELRVADFALRVRETFPDAPGGVLTDVMEFLSAMVDRGLVLVDVDGP